MVLDEGMAQEAREAPTPVSNNLELTHVSRSSDRSRYTYLGTRNVPYGMGCV
jgi:hypothetical protein